MDSPPTVALVVGEDVLFDYSFIAAALEDSNVAGIFIQNGFLDFRRLWLLFRITSLGDLVLLCKLVGERLAARSLVIRKVNGQGLRLSKFRNIEELPSILKSLDIAPDLVVSYNGVSRWPDAVLALPKVGCMNLHLGALPKFRGLSPVIHAVAQGETTLGVTYHWMEKSFDQGASIAAGSLQIPGKSSLFSIYAQLNALARDLFKIAAMTAISAGTGSDAGKPPEESNYFSAPDARTVRQAKRALTRLKGGA